MIRIDKNVVETKGDAAQLLTELTLGVKRLNILLGRDYVMPMLMSAIYCLKSDQKEFFKFDLKEALSDFKEDTSLALKYIEQYANLAGDTPQEKFKSELEEMEKKIGDIKNELDSD